MSHLLASLFILFGVVDIAIGLGIYAFGPHATASFFGQVVGSLTGLEAYVGGLDNANINSEMRFYSVFWVAYGVALVWFGRHPEANKRILLLLLGMFFLGGLGRQLGHLSGGQPDLLFVALGWIELTLPILLGAVLSFVRSTK